ncbi:MAG TPA: DUF92 domain-containing protein [Puia sp.]|nr:DUF92 domain-containing protein [Puia sp.]
MIIKALLLFFILGCGIFYSLVRRKLTAAAAFTGAALALCVYAGAGFAGITMMTVFFILGSAATSWKLQWKRREGLAENEKGTRTAMQVVANAGVPAILGLVGFLYADTVLPVMMAGAFAAATADTLSSELGNIYGSRYYNILSFKRDQRGLNGVISLEGTLCGLAGSLLIAFIFAAGFGWNGRVVMIIALAGTVGNITDSLLGATMERKHWIGNNAVNFLNTAVGALSVWVLQWII